MPIAKDMFLSNSVLISKYLNTTVTVNVVKYCTLGKSLLRVFSEYNSHIIIFIVFPYFYRRQILTSKIGHCTERIKTL